MTPTRRVVLFARFLKPGRGKTRPIPALEAKGVATLHRRLTKCVVATLRAGGLPFEPRHTGAGQDVFCDRLGEDVLLAEQGKGDLGAAWPALRRNRP